MRVVLLLCIVCLCGCSRATIDDAISGTAQVNDQKKTESVVSDVCSEIISMEYKLKCEEIRNQKEQNKILMELVQTLKNK